MFINLLKKTNAYKQSLVSKQEQPNEQVQQCKEQVWLKFADMQTMAVVMFS